MKPMLESWGFVLEGIGSAWWDKCWGNPWVTNCVSTLMVVTYVGYVL